MKIILYAKIAFLLSFILSITCSLTAMDAEFEVLNPTQAKMLGTKYKKDAALIPVKPAHHDHLAPLGVITDTDYLLQGITDGNNDKYVAFAKAGIKAIVGPWIDSLLAGNIRFLEADPTAVSIPGGTEKNRKKRDAFKLKLAEIIENVPLAGMPGASADATLRNLKVTKTAVSTEIIRVVNDWIDTLPLNGGNLIAVTVKHDGNAGAPADQTPAAFKTAVENLIKTF